MARNILELSTLTERSTVTIDGKAYELINPEGLSIVDTNRVGKWGMRVQELYRDLENRSEEEIQELASLLDRLCRLLLPAPDEVHARLTDNQRLSVATVFIALQRGTLPVAAEAKATPERATEPVAAGPSATSTGENS